MASILNILLNTSILNDWDTVDLVYPRANTELSHIYIVALHSHFKIAPYETEPRNDLIILGELIRNLPIMFII